MSSAPTVQAVSGNKSAALKNRYAIRPTTNRAGSTFSALKAMIVDSNTAPPTTTVTSSNHTSSGNNDAVYRSNNSKSEAAGTASNLRKPLNGGAADTAAQRSANSGNNTSSSNNKWSVSAKSSNNSKADSTPASIAKPSAASQLLPAEKDAINAAAGIAKPVNGVTRHLPSYRPAPNLPGGSCQNEPNNIAKKLSNSTNKAVSPARSLNIASTTANQTAKRTDQVQTASQQPAAAANQRASAISTAINQQRKPFGQQLSPTYQSPALKNKSARPMYQQQQLQQPLGDHNPNTQTTVPLSRQASVPSGLDAKSTPPNKAIISVASTTSERPSTAVLAQGSLENLPDCDPDWSMNMRYRSKIHRRAQPPRRPNLELQQSQQSDASQEFCKNKPLPVAKVPGYVDSALHSPTKKTHGSSPFDSALDDSSASDDAPPAIRTGTATLRQSSIASQFLPVVSSPSSDNDQGTDSSVPQQKPAILVKASRVAVAKTRHYVGNNRKQASHNNASPTKAFSFSDLPAARNDAVDLGMVAIVGQKQPANYGSQQWQVYQVHDGCHHQGSRVWPGTESCDCCCCQRIQRETSSVTSTTISNTPKSPCVAVGQEAPPFKGWAVFDGCFKEVALSDYAGKILLIFFYYRDFSKACCAELRELNSLTTEFQKVACEIVCLSTDSHYSHLAWITTSRSEGGLGAVSFPLIGDTTHQITNLYGVLKQDEGLAYRAHFIVDTKGIVRQFGVNDVTLTRNVPEILKLTQQIANEDTSSATVITH